MNKRGVVLIFSLLVMAVLTVLLAGLYFQSVSESQLANRYVHSMRAFWLAEAGVAQFKSRLGISPVSGYVDDTHYAYNVPSPSRIGLTDYYTVVSTGTVSLPGGGSVDRTISVTMKLIPPSASKFQYPVETTSSAVDYKVKNVVNEEDTTHIVKTGSKQGFEDLFGVSTATMEAGADNHYESRNLVDSLTVNGIAWVDVTDAEGQLDPSGLFQIEHLNGRGILVVCGDFKITGLGTFDGIVYVIGTLTMVGNPTINGVVFAESSASIGADVSGSSLVNYSSSAISDALRPLSTKQVVSWKEQED